MDTKKITDEYLGTCFVSYQALYKAKDRTTGKWGMRTIKCTTFAGKTGLVSQVTGCIRLVDGTEFIDHGYGMKGADFAKTFTYSQYENNANAYLLKCHQMTLGHWPAIIAEATQHYITTERTMNDA